MAVDHHALITDRVIAALHAGTGPFALPWTQSFALPVKLDGSCYRGVNVLSLWVSAYLQGFRASQWGGFHGWRKLDGHVRRDERATRIVFVRPVERENDTGDTERFYVGRSWSVFCRDQIDGLADDTTPDLYRLADDATVRTVEAVAERAGITVHVRGQQAMYRVRQDVILMPGQDLFRDTETQSAARHYASTLAHELVHATGAATRLDRAGITGERTRAIYAEEELVAELGAAFLCAELGFGYTGVEDSAAYVANWLTALADDNRVVFRAAHEATRAVRFLLGEPEDDDA